MRHADGGSDGGVRVRGGCRWIEEFTVKGVGAFALADGDQRRLTGTRKMARRIFSRILLSSFDLALEAPCQGELPFIFEASCATTLHGRVSYTKKKLQYTFSNIPSPYDPHISLNGKNQLVKYMPKHRRPPH